MEQNENSLSETFLFSGSMTYEDVLSRDGECTTHVVGDSMLPLLKNRKSIVHVISVAERAPKIKDVVLYKQGGKYVLHRILSRDADIFIVRGDTNYFLERVPVADILGVMDGFYWRPSFSYISCRSVIYKLYIIFLPVIRPVRRMLIRIKRLIKNYLDRV